MSVDERIREAHEILDEAWWQHVGKPGKTLRGIVVLFSGGNDSTVLAHLMRERATHFGMANTTIGIERTRQFVRDTSAAWGVPLIEKVASGGDTYRAHVLKHGFPGPAMHDRMFQRLKERQFRKIRRDLILHSRRDRVIFVAGRRAAESARRTSRWKRGEIVEHEREGSIVWCSPILHWTDADMAEYRREFDVPRNEVSDMIHMSGECLCGAFASPGERDEVGFFFPDWKAEIEALEAEVAAAGIAGERARWGWGADQPVEVRRRSHKPGRLCDSCTYRQESLDLWGDAA